MAGYVTLGEVRTWYDERGSGEPVVLLHGALGDSAVFDGNLAALADAWHLYLPERRGHGRTPDVAGPLAPSGMAADTIAFLETVVRTPAHLVGYSAGAVVALEVAVRGPDLLRRLVVISGAFHRDGWLLPPATPEQLPAEIAARYGELSPDGVEHFPTIVNKIAESSADEADLSEEQLAAVPNRTLVMCGDDDVARLENTVALYRALPDSELAVIPGGSHCALLEKPELCTALVREFLGTDPKPTFMPVRRAH